MMINEQDKKYLLSLKPDDLTFSFIVSLFGNTVKNGDDLKKTKSSRFNPTDEMKLTKSDYFVKEDTLTTVGRFIYNKYIVERCEFQGILGYVNVAITAKMLEKIEQKLVDALIEDKISIEQWVNYINYRDTMGYQHNSVITSSFTLKTLKVPNEIKADKKVLFKKYEKELSSGDPLAAEKIGNELMDKCREKFKGDVGMDLYDSGARGNFGNYKNMMLFKGTSFNNITGKYDIVKSSFMDGIKKEDIHAFGNEVINGSYPKAVGTQKSGYTSKKLVASMQSEVLGEKGSNCHSTKTLELVLSEKDMQDFMYRYIVDNGKEICLTPEVSKKYIGKTIHLKSPMYCKDDDTCNICAGDMSYKMNTKNIGLNTPTISTKLLNLSMKKFQISVIKSSIVDIDDIFL